MSIYSIIALVLNFWALPTLVVAKLENENEATFKQYMIDAGRSYLKALNPHHPPTIINGNCKIIGVVVDIKWEHIP